jgi:hypothetical protein
MFLARVLRSPSDCSARGGGGGAAARPGAKFKLRFSVCAKSRFLPGAQKSAKSNIKKRVIFRIFFYFIFFSSSGGGV